MKKPHRRFHLIVWSALAPLTFLVGIAIYLSQAATPLMDIPAPLTIDLPSR